MRIDIRIYKRFDTDLVALCDAGYPLSRMFRDALTAFAYGQPLHYLVDSPVRFNPDGRSSVHYAFSIPDSDKITCGLLKSIQTGYRNSFCKAVLRNAMVNQNIGCFLNPSHMDMAKAQIAAIDPALYQNIIPLSVLRSGGGQMRFQIGTPAVSAHKAVQSAEKIVVPDETAAMPKQNPVQPKPEPEKKIPESETTRPEPETTRPEPQQAPQPEPMADDNVAPALADNDALMKVFEAL